MIVASGLRTNRPSLRAYKLVRGVFDDENTGMYQGEILHGKHNGIHAYHNGHTDQLHLHGPSRVTLGELLGCDSDDVMLSSDVGESLVKLMNTHIHPQILGKRRKVMCLAQDFNTNIPVVRNFLLNAVVNALFAAKPIFDEGDGNEMADLLRQSQQGREFRRLTAIFLNGDVSDEEKFKEIERNFLVIVQPSGESGIYNEEDIVAVIESCHNELGSCTTIDLLLHISTVRYVPDKWCIFEQKCSMCVGLGLCGRGAACPARDRIVCGAGSGYNRANGHPSGAGFIYQNAALVREIMSNDSVGISPTPMSIKHLSVETQCGKTKQQPVESVQRHEGSNSEVLSLKVLIADLQIFSCYDISSIMALREALCKCLIQCLDYFFTDEIAAGTFRYITPLDKKRRGITICFSLAGVDAKCVKSALYTDRHNIGYKFEVDLRPANEYSDICHDILFLTPHYCHMSFSDTANLAFAIHHAYKRIVSGLAS